MKFVLASNNNGKLLEMRAMLSKYGHQVISQKEAGFFEEVEETGTTFEENSFIKAAAACKATGLPAVADDSGIMVKALGGEPGVYSARYAGENKTDKERNEYLLEKMKDKDQREAKFVSVITCVFPNGDKIVARGECLGQLLHQEKGSNGFGYDPLFYIPSEGKTMAEISPERKNVISHRANAIREFEKKLEEYLRK
jgi:XTP/dITP diphosphohydrolase